MSTAEARHRATFESPYAVPKAQRHPKSTRSRLGDQLLCVVEFGAPDFLQETCSGEFSVIDLATRQKAWFEAPIGFPPEEIAAMIESHFDATAFRVDARLWIVQC